MSPGHFTRKGFHAEDPGGRVCAEIIFFSVLRVPEFPNGGAGGGGQGEGGLGISA